MRTITAARSNRSTAPVAKPTKKAAPVLKLKTKGKKTEVFKTTKKATKPEEKPTKKSAPVVKQVIPAPMPLTREEMKSLHHRLDAVLAKDTDEVMELVDLYDHVPEAMLTRPGLRNYREFMVTLKDLGFAINPGAKREGKKVAPVAKKTTKKPAPAPVVKKTKKAAPVAKKTTKKPAKKTARR